jgi:bifunctional DNA-binding transcriptional regulator/antitoxin component of YhaV-PrlF toxin-antitoxin module
MSVVEIDKRGRMTIPKNAGIKQSRAIVIDAGAFFITIPLTKTPEKETENWLPASVERKDLKVEAERLAGDDAVRRAKRRNQL